MEMKFKKKILFFPTHMATFNEMLPVMERLKDYEDSLPYVVITRKGMISNRDLLNIKENYKLLNIDMWCRGKYFDGKGVSALFLSMTPSVVMEFIGNYRRYRKMNIIASSFLRDICPHAVALLGDRSLGWETAIVKQANRQNIKTVIIPFAYSHPVIAIWHRLKKENNNRYMANKYTVLFLKCFFPNWLYCENEKHYLFYPLVESFAAKLCGVMPDKPWALTGGKAKIAAVESKYMCNVMIEAGVLPSKIVVTGKPSLDNVSHKLQYGKIRNKIIFSVPQYAEQGMTSWEEHLTATDYILSCLVGLMDCVVIISLHPKSPRKRYDSLAKKHGVSISKLTIYDLLLEARLLVCGPSSMLFFALALDIHSISLNYLSLCSTSSPLPKSIYIKVMNDLEELAAFLNASNFLNGYDYSPSKNNILNGSEWALLDGNCTARVASLITS